MKQGFIHRRMFAALLLAFSLWLGGGRAYAAFTSIPWAMEGDGFVPTNAQGLIELTNGNASIDGVAWNPCAISMSSNWTLDFIFNFGAKVMECGGDGMSFILQAASNNGNSPTTIAGPTNGSSTSGEKAFTGIPDSLEIAFNTYLQPYMVALNTSSSLNVLVNGDDEASYSDVVGCGTGANQIVTGPCFPSMSATEPNVQDGADHTVQIAWNSTADTLTVTFDGSVRAVYTLPANYVTSIFNSDTNVIYGVGASSGDATDIQQFEQTNADPSLCEATPTLGATATLVPLPTDNCNNTPAPTLTPAGPTNTPTITPTPYPTPCGGEDAYEASANLADGQVGDSGNPATENYTYTVGTTVTNALVMVVVQNPSSGQSVTGVTFGGTGLTPGPSTTNVSGGKEQVYYLTVGDLLPGNDTVAVTYGGTGSQSFLVSVYILGNVNQTTPIGATAGATNVTAEGDYNATITPDGTDSIIMDFMVATNGCAGPGYLTYSSGQTGIGPLENNGSGTYTYSDYVRGGLKSTADTLVYDNVSNCGGSLSWWLVEVESPDSCGTNTDTVTSTKTPTPTFSDTATMTRTATPTPTKTVTSTDTYTVNPTPTDTSTSTSTSTKTLTQTSTVTASPTRTSTVTPTDTYTVTDTPTESVTFTSTSTVTASPTRTATVSPTDTYTATSTVTASPTRTATVSPSDTYTATDTVTPSPTRTDSPTATSTDTATETFTASPQDSPTDTSTDTSTFTVTRTSTATPTVTLTATESVTSTDTPTATATFTATLTFTASPQDSPTDTPTDTSTFTATRTSTATPTLTLTETASATPTSTSSFTASPQDTATDTPSVTDTPTDTPTDTDTWTYTPTDTDSSTPSVTDTQQATPTDTATDTPTSTPTPTPTVTSTSTASASPTFTFTVTQTYTVTNTPVPEPYTVTVGIYNSAGELVRSLYSGTSQYPANQAQIQSVEGSNGQQVDITGLGGAAGNLVWSENNNNGQAVTSGVYTVQITSVNTFGQVTTQDDAVAVVSTQAAVTLDVYNSAGELVANLSGQLVGVTSTVTGMSLQVTALIPDTTPVANVTPTIKVNLANGSTQSVDWSGTNTQGQPLQPGNYLVTLSVAESGGDQILETKTIVILKSSGGSAQDMAASALVVPNPVDQNSFTVQYQGDGGTDTAVGVLYTLTGERVSEAADNGGGVLSFSGNWPSGIYLLNFEVHNGASGVLARRILKVAVIR